MQIFMILSTSPKKLFICVKRLPSVICIIMCTQTTMVGGHALRNCTQSSCINSPAEWVVVDDDDGSGWVCNPLLLSPSVELPLS